MDLKEQIKAELEAGGKSVAQLAREYGPSHPTIMGWKREWGMTRPRARKTPAR
jgi:transposase-like protein